MCSDRVIVPLWRNLSRDGECACTPFKLDQIKLDQTAKPRWPSTSSRQYRVGSPWMKGEQMAVVPGGSRGRACFPCGIVGCCLVQSNAVRPCAALNTELENVGSPWKLPLPRRTV